jgi:hypothetical protein
MRAAVGCTKRCVSCPADLLVCARLYVGSVFQPPPATSRVHLGSGAAMTDSSKPAPGKAEQVLWVGM